MGVVEVAGVVVVAVEAVVGEEVVRVVHKPVLEALVGAVGEGEEVAVLGVDRTLLQGLLQTARARRCLRLVLGNLPVHPKRESLAQQTLAPGEAQERRT